MTQTALTDPATLTRHIETRFHARHREQLPALTALAEKVETIHFGDEHVPEGLADLLERMIGALEVHMKKEELVLFPALAVAIALISFTFLGDGLRDALDPKLKGKQ